MKFVKRILLGLLSLLLVLLLTVMGLIYWIVKNPQEAWQFAESRYLPKDLKITWQHIDFQGRRPSGLNFHFDLNITGLNISKGTPFIQLPIQDLALSVELFPKDSIKRVLIHKVNVSSTERIDIKLEKPDQKEPEKNPFQQAEAIFTRMQKLNLLADIRNLKIAVTELRFASGDAKPLTFSLKAEQGGEGADRAIQIASKLTLALEKPFELEIDGVLKLPNMGSESPFLEGILTVHGAGTRTKQKISLVSYQERVRVTSSGKINYSLAGKKQLTLQPRLKIILSQNEAVTEIDASFAGLPGPLVTVDHFRFRMQTPLDEDLLWSEKPSTFTATAPIALFFIDEDMRRPLEKSCECKIPEVLKLELKGQAWLANLLAEPAEQKPILDSRLAIEGVHNKLLSVDAAAKIKIDKKVSKYSLTPSLDLEASINNFQGFRRFLDAKNILIPAPLNLLDGTVKISSHDLVKTSEKEYILPVSVTTALTSPRQVVNITTDTVLRLSADFKEMYIDVLAKIDSLQLELPPLDPMRGKPRVTLDRRILKAPPVAKPKPSKFKVYLNVSVDTTKPAAIRLLSRYFKPHLPLTMSLHRSKEKDNTGFIQTEPFQIEYLRRKVQVEKMRLDLPPSETEPIPVDARFKIRQSQYTVFIHLAGPINKPDIRLTSEPYLSESEIISVLLYDRVSKDLVGGDAETAGNVQAAMADRAIGLFGLWAFAATPIKSFSYNAVTKVYSATVALTDDVTAGIGTNWEEATRLELRKRVSKSWMLTAAWVPATQEEEQKTNLVLQWEKRF